MATAPRGQPHESLRSIVFARNAEDQAAAHARQLKEQKSQSRKEGNIAGRKPRRFWSACPLVTLPHAPGLSHSLPADNCYTGVRLDWVIRKVL
jgi:hypothetical protein